MYKPSFTITNKMLSYTISITEKLGKIKFFKSLKRLPTLRKNNRIKSIHSSLAIEANSLSLNSVKDIIDGVTIIGPKKEIQEVKNAYNAYNSINEFNGYSIDDLLKCHYMLMSDIESDAGKYRNHPEGVFDGKKVIFIAPPENMVPSLMNDLFTWLRTDQETHILIKSCIFHYEFVFIHPFSDGNGRMARIWQNVLLTKWNPIFEYIPIESRIYLFQEEYYQVISKGHTDGTSTIFTEFMLRMIDETLDEVLNSVKNESLNISVQVNRLLDVMETGIPLSANTIMERLGIKSKETLRNSYLNSALENGLIKMTIPDKPNSKNQRYVKI